MSSISAPMPCSAQKSSISWVSLEPIAEPAKERRCVSSEKASTGSGSAGAPTLTIAPSVPSRPSKASTSTWALTVLMISSKRPASCLNVAGSLVA
jgi:hypothetical protein